MKNVTHFYLFLDD